MKVLLPKWIKRFFKDEKHLENLSFFRRISIFRHLSGRQLGWIMQAMQRRHYEAGEPLFREGQVGKAVFLIRSGRVELSKKGEKNKERLLGVLGSGQIFGEMALLEELPRTASATVVEEGDIYLLYTTTLNALIKRYPLIGVKLMKNMAVMLSALLRKTNKEMEQRRTARAA